MELQFIVDWMNSQTGTVSLSIAAVGGVCALVSAFLPTPTPSSSFIYRAAYSVINWLGCNVGKAKNADDVASAEKLK